ncbi:MAG: hypothetical protein HND52_01680 [Ignavibacteriae bacterium]|nr:hypothetical protein [Ignavibacteriota bacterium]NOG96661.1 hypothetical protein [Ignavibacteriota bacterium]
MKKNIQSISLFLLITLGLTSCFDVPDEFVAPVWDVDLNVPVSVKKYTLADIIKDDPNFIVEYNDPASLGRITYLHEEELTSTHIDEILKIDEFEADAAHRIEEIKIGEIEPISINAGVEEVFPGLSSGSTQIIPSAQVPFNSNFGLNTAFENATFSNGELLFKVKNNLPVGIELRGFQIINAIDGSVLFSRSSNSSDWIIIAPNDSASVPFSLNNKTVTNNLRFESQIFTPGSENQPVVLPEYSAIEITMEVQEGFAISSAVAVLPVQNKVISENSIAVQSGSQPSQFQRTVLGSGSFDILIDNYFDLDLTLELTIDNLFKADGSIFSSSVTLTPNESGRMISEPDLAGWVLDNNGVASEYISYKLGITIHNSETPRAISVEDSVAIHFSFGKMTLESFIGRVSPSDIEIAPDTFNLNLGNPDEILTFDEIILENPNIILEVISPTTFEIMLNGTISISNGIESNELALNNILIQPAGVTGVELKDFGLEELMNSFSEKFPKNFSFSGTATLNPNYLTGSISGKDSITSNLDFVLPLNAGISGGIITDTVKNNLTDNLHGIEDLNYAVVKLELTNEIPLSLACVGTFNDINGATQLNLPPRPIMPGNKDTIFVDPPRVDYKGNTITAGYRIQELELFGDEVKKFLESPIMTFQVRFVTPPNGTNLPVIFNIKDELNFKISAKASYRVDIN